jgi:alkylated DNA repair dioxygenase AlkB
MKRFLVPSRFSGPQEENDDDGKVAEVEKTAEELARATGIDGLILMENFIDEHEEAALIEAIDAREWSNQLKRRTQQYGHIYDYSSRAEGPSKKADPIPEAFRLVVERLSDKSLLHDPDQVIVNEYQPGQGIGAHIDHKTKFEDNIGSLSLLTPVTMEFTRTKDSKKVRLLLPRRSLLLMRREARYEWSHGISPVKTDPLTKQARKRRVSLTFRKMATK